MYSSIFVILSPWKRTGHFIWTNLNPLHSRMLYVKFGWNWPSCSGEEDESVKSLQRQRRQRIKLTWAFGSDELKTERIIGFITGYKILPKVYTEAFLNRAVFCRKLWFYIVICITRNWIPPPRESIWFFINVHVHVSSYHMHLTHSIDPDLRCFWPKNCVRR